VSFIPVLRLLHQSNDPIMAFNPKGLMDIYEIVSRWHAGYTISHISRALGVDRKTIRRHVVAAEASGVLRGEPLPPRDQLLPMLSPLVIARKRSMPARSIFEPFRDEILRLLEDPEDPLKPKTVFEVLCHRHAVEASYSSFKRYIRVLLAEKSGARTTCRFEVEPGEELQLDYGSVGRLNDETGRERKVYAFIGTLSASRYKFIEFVFSQDQRSFASSHVRMFDWFGGVPRAIVVDNLKSGILKPDHYDPTLNPLYAELASYYGFFVDAARAHRPKDKGKVERSVPQARELFRKLKVLYPQLTLAEASMHAREWCRYENGERPHGTTGRRPANHFESEERAALLALPENPFEMATWKQVKVHPDQYIQFERKTYSAPLRYVGHRLWVRATDKTIELYTADFSRIKTHIRSSRYRTTDPSDFPTNVRMMMKDEAVRRLLARARAVGPSTLAFITQLLEPHAKRNFRKAQGILSLAERHGIERLESAAATALANDLVTYQAFKELVLSAPEQESTVPVGEATSALVRAADYFIHSTP
jgi:transposase